MLLVGSLSLVLSLVIVHIYVEERISQDKVTPSPPHTLGLTTNACMCVCVCVCVRARAVDLTPSVTLNV